jgi:NAD(P) transhydrogenase subunit alpha
LRSVKIAVAKETREGENRVAMVPELVGKLTTLGYEVAVEPGAGAAAQFSDDQYSRAGAAVSGGALDGAVLVVSVQALDSATVRRLRPGTATLSFLPTAQSLDLVTDLQAVSPARSPWMRCRRRPWLRAIALRSWPRGYCAASSR